MDATYYYHFELGLPEEKRRTPSAEAAALMWNLVKNAQLQQRLQIMDIAQQHASSQKDGKLTKQVAAVVLKEYLKPQEVSTPDASHCTE
jgi:hypothetical protein